MTKLSCGVDTCIHNHDKYCCISNISVGGAKAMSEGETCCDSFIEKKDSITNCCVDHKCNPVVDVSCKALNCQYNEDCKCHAEDIHIDGSSACHCHDTRCETFTLS